MALFKFRISWEEDNNIERDIEILSSSTFETLHAAVIQVFGLKPTWGATINVLNEAGKLSRVIDTAVEKNIKDAPALSAKKTPIGAMVSHPSQEFIYNITTEKDWSFFINLITMELEVPDPNLYPRMTRSEGLSPMELGGKGIVKDAVVETDDKYDLADQASDEDDDFGGGFGIEGGDDAGADEGSSAFTEEF